MATIKYDGINRGEDTRFKVNNNILKMMYANPTLGIGYLIGNALGENYFGKKRAKSSQEANDAQFKGSVGADEKNGAYGTDNKNGNDYYASMNNAMKQYQGNGGKVLYEGRTTATPDGVIVDTERGIYPRTPQQNNTSGVTVGNAGNDGGITSVADAYNRMANGSGYNSGNTGLYTNGVRNMGNVIGADANGVYGVPTGIGADANGVYGISAGGSAPSAANIPRSPQTAVPSPNPTPIPYTPEQLAQIQAQGYSPEELRRMGAAELVAPTAQSDDGLLTSVAERYAPVTPTAPATPQSPANIDKIIAGDDEIYERGNPFAGPSTPFPVSRRGTRAMAAAWQQDPNIMNVAGSNPAPQLVYPNEVDPRLLELAANLQYGDR